MTECFHLEYEDHTIQPNISISIAMNVPHQYKKGTLPKYSGQPECFINSKKGSVKEIKAYLFFAMTHIAWMIPGIYPKSVKRILSQKCFPMPTCRKTPSGGRRIEIRILTSSIITPIVINFDLTGINQFFYFLKRKK